MAVLYVAWFRVTRHTERFFVNALERALGLAKLDLLGKVGVGRQH